MFWQAVWRGWGGPIPALIYRGGLELFEYLSPVLPDASWAVQSLFGTLVPLLCLGLVWELYGQEARLRRSPEQGSQLGWIATGTAIILILWFAMGVFSYSPRVIVSGSMRPSMDIGDMVVIKSMTGDQAQLGDVILFPQGNMKVVHRIIEVREVEGKRSFITKGDANGEADNDLVYEKAVQGKVIMVIPKVGYLTLLFRA